MTVSTVNCFEKADLTRLCWHSLTQFSGLFCYLILLYFHSVVLFERQLVQCVCFDVWSDKCHWFQLFCIVCQLSWVSWVGQWHVLACTAGDAGVDEGAWSERRLWLARTKSLLAWAVSRSSSWSDERRRPVRSWERQQCAAIHRRSAASGLRHVRRHTSRPHSHVYHIISYRVRDL